MVKHQVYLIPGFFGFSALGGLSYFRQVRQTLEDVFLRRGVEVEFIEVDTLPTASLRARASRLLETAVMCGADKPGVIVHFVGHSTGALDARLAASPGASLPAFKDERAHRVLENLRTIASISGAHYGTPLANFFTTIYGKNLLYLITLLVIVGLWRRPIVMLGSLLRALGKINDLLGLDETLLHQVTNQLLRDFNPTVQSEVRQFLRSVLDDQGVMVQLTPEGMDLFNATTLDRPGVRYVSWATAAPPPTEVIKRITLRHALTPLNKVLYSLLWTLTSRVHAGYRYHEAALKPVDASTGRALPFSLSERTSDGVVPTMSQVWGELRGIVCADHLDVIGHYLRGPFDERDGADWFGSGAGFERASFEWLWEDVAIALLSE
jgi:triacylglycerol esterase/lipase EstA (alpha/beta hydrolase family)